MEKETRNTLIVICVILVLMIGAYSGIKAYSGVSPPFTVINSGSMMHSSDSRIGIIDTGDMIVVKDPDTIDIHTYVDGEKSGYRKFGEYGDVIVYKKPNQNIIHRAMLHLELKSGSTSKVVWYIPSLKDYYNWGMCPTSASEPSEELKAQCWNEETCELTITSANSECHFCLIDVGYAKLKVTINLYNLGHNKAEGYSGYLTKGDNASTNTRFDQTSGIYDNKLVEDNIIKSVAVFEIPWIGSIKLMVNGNGSNVPTNSIVYLILSILALIATVVMMSIILSYVSRRMEERPDEPSQ